MVAQKWLHCYTVTQMNDLKKPFSCTQCNKTFIVGNKSCTDE